jgi:putative hydrolase of HD superfamily
MYQKISDFIFELGVLKKLPRTGSFIAGVKNPDSVAEHVFRASNVAFILAELEGANSERASFLVTIHDNAESRIGDLHKIAVRYIDKHAAEKNAFDEQIQNLPEKIQKKFVLARDEFETRETPEAKCAHDADLLELAFEAKELLEQGYTGMQEWLRSIKPALITVSAQKIFAQLEKMSAQDWWKGLKNLEDL